MLSRADGLICDSLQLHQRDSTFPLEKLFDVLFV